MNEQLWPTPATIVAFVKADSRANARDQKAQLVLVLLRVTQLVMGRRDGYRAAAIPLIIVYRFLTEWILGLELRPKTVAGPGLAIHHGFGLVVNDGVRIGARVTLRNAVTIGHKRPGGGVPVLLDDVNVGAGAIILGPVVIGKGATIGAGSVVTHDVAPGQTVVGRTGAHLKDERATLDISGDGGP